MNVAIRIIELPTLRITYHYEQGNEGALVVAGFGCEQKSNTFIWERHLYVGDLEQM